MRSEQLTRRARRPAATVSLGAVAAAVLLACGQPAVPAPPTPATAPTPAPMPYLPDDVLDAPAQPPALSLTSGSGPVAPQMIALDWSARGGPVADPPERVDWPVARIAPTVSLVQFEFGTPRLPTRVVLYRYPRVGEHGVPDEADGTEVVCGSADRDATCRRDGDGRGPAGVVVPFDGTAGAYWVIHAGWPVLDGRVGDDVEVVWASWAIRIDQET